MLKEYEIKFNHIIRGTYRAQYENFFTLEILELDLVSCNFYVHIINPVKRIWKIVL